ncbi:cytochrome P450 [Lindgomyces ingoldianus]|uniref:Cytochrome P450 n=1 Tax=Lindgomyces ingoldianus TaxID=673940 RepID=A0ACB6R5G2_9PLEO|nr:cytochrome P450 [Lindgomyces ingoldianus]KAF2474421.1 cytochrome P450 [Lindgomyces ingoldianus]
MAKIQYLIPVMAFAAVLFLVGFLHFRIQFAVAIYRLTFHPLARYPGPWYAAISEISNIYSCLNGERHLQFKSWHDRYGSVVRYAPNRLSFCDKDAIQDIYGVRSNTQKSRVYGGFNHIFKASASLTCIDRSQHSFKRKILNVALQPIKLKNFEKHVLRNLKIFIDNVLTDASGAEWSRPRNLSEIIQFLFTDIMGDMMFSQNWNVQTSDSKRWILDILILGTSGLHAAGHMILALKLNLDMFLVPKTMAATRRFLAIARSQCEEHIRKDRTYGEHADLFSLFIQASNINDPKSDRQSYAFTMDDLVAETGILIIAGADTTATTVTATLYYLLQNPEILQQVQSEVDEAFSRIKKLGLEFETSEGLSSCQLLRACTEETMRLSPPVAGLLPREVLQGGLLIANRWSVPAGVDVGVPVYAIHHNEKYWESPHHFDPMRWIERYRKDCRHTFMPFGVGRTGCVGKQLAYNEISLVLARILWTYDLEMMPSSQSSGSGFGGNFNGSWGRGNKDEFQTRDFFTSSHHGPIVRFRKRLSSAAISPDG